MFLLHKILEAFEYKSLNYWLDVAFEHRRLRRFIIINVV